MKLACVAVVVACGSRTPHDPTKATKAPPIEAPREVFSAYHLGELRVEGAPPIDQAIAKRVDRRSSARSARLLDLTSSWRTLALAAAESDCVLLVVGGTRMLDDGHLCKSDVGWAGFGPTLPVVATVGEDDAETSTLRFRNRGVDLPTGHINDPVWDRDRTQLYFGLATDHVAELWVMSNGTAHRVATGGPWAPLDVSVDGRFVLARRELSTRDVALYRIEVATGDAIALTEPGATTGTFTRDGDLLAISEADDRRQLFRYTTWGRSPIARGIAGDIVEVVATDDGAVVIAADQGISTLWQVDRAGMATPVPGVPDDGVLSDLRAAHSEIGWSTTSTTRPRSILIRTPDPKAPGYVDARWPLDPPPPAVAATFHEVTASDGVKSQLLVYQPPNVDKAPVIVELHGGPEDRWLPKYDGFAQLLVGQGYAMVRPNVRGSTGQGRAFGALDDGLHREDVLRDVAATLDWIATQPQLDGKRVAVLGTSYGGYLALASLLAFPDRLRGGVTLGAITDFVGFLEGTAPYRRDHRRAEYGDERDPATRVKLAGMSPIAHVTELSRPLMMAYGLRDPRVPPATAGRFVREARAAGVPVWSLAAADEGHWFEHADNRRVFEILTLQFLASLDRR